MQHNLKMWNKKRTKHNIKINIEKTKLMVIAKDDIEAKYVTVNRTEIKQVKTFTYYKVVY